eukprot:TRINITY_DN91890_c0_g1_i1.p1 TRINITY_DN91890_c0_g1~~TRINITY_DN91890_c0_g1_i1.p1  ORF type:complete len:485 (-),score=92.72 TRINITY_DN91890_c0_g1_i1:292-1746(-)
MLPASAPVPRTPNSAFMLGGAGRPLVGCEDRASGGYAAADSGSLDSFRSPPTSAKTTDRGPSPRRRSLWHYSPSSAGCGSEIASQASTTAPPGYRRSVSSSSIAISLTPISTTSLASPSSPAFPGMTAMEFSPSKDAARSSFVLHRSNSGRSSPIASTLSPHGTPSLSPFFQSGLSPRRSASRLISEDEETLHPAEISQCVRTVTSPKEQMASGASSTESTTLDSDLQEQLASRDSESVRSTRIASSSSTCSLLEMDKFSKKRGQTQEWLRIACQGRLNYVHTMEKRMSAQEEEEAKRPGLVSQRRQQILQNAQDKRENNQARALSVDATRKERQASKQARRKDWVRKQEASFDEFLDRKRQDQEKAAVRAEELAVHQLAVKQEAERILDERTAVKADKVRQHQEKVEKVCRDKSLVFDLRRKVQAEADACLRYAAMEVERVQSNKAYNAEAFMQQMEDLAKEARLAADHHVDETTRQLRLPPP